MLVFAGTIATTREVVDVLAAFNAIGLRLKAHMEPKHYGASVQEFYLGFLCLSPPFSALAKPRRDIYTKARKVHSRDGFEIVREKVFECEVALPYEAVLTASPAEVRRLLSQEVLQAIERLHKHRHKFEDFDVPAFIRDIHDFFAHNALPVD